MTSSSLFDHFVLDEFLAACRGLSQPSPERWSGPVMSPVTGLRDSPTDPASGALEVAAATATDSSTEG